MIGTTLPHSIRLSPNINERRGKKPISILVLHYTGMSNAEKACDWLCNEKSQVSCHYLVDEMGHIVQMVDEKKRAWHAGVSSWHGATDINSISIGIEIQNPGHSMGYPDFPKRQVECVANLSLDIVVRHEIKAQNVLAHSDVAPGRKIDPGEKFDWAYLHSRGVGAFVVPEPITSRRFLKEGDEGDGVLALQDMLKLYGYGLEATARFDRRTRIVIEAFQRHFRPGRVDGIADASTVATLRRLLRTV